MPADRSHEKENRAQLERLRALVQRATEADLRRPMPAGWTVAGVLGHLAFWDQRVLVLLGEWDRTGAPPPPIDEAAVDWINDAGKPIALAVPPRAMADLALGIAEAVDRRIAALPDARIAANLAAGKPVNLLRAAHRREHLDEIEHALRGA